MNFHHSTRGISIRHDRVGRGESVALALLYLLSSVTVFKVKETLLLDGGYRIMSRLAGQGEEALGWLARLHLFSLDVLLLLGFVPLLLMGLSLVVSRKVLARSVLLLCLAMITLSFINVNALGTTGKFLSIDQIGPMLDWVWERPASVLEYVSPGAWFKLLVLILLVSGMYRYRGGQLFSAFQAGPLLIVFALGTLNMLALYARHADPMPVSNFNLPALTQMGKSLFPTGAGLSVADRADASGRLGFQCQSKQAPADPARRPGRRNFVLFIMETVPDELFLQAQGKGFGTYDALRRSGYTAAHHYSTYPFTSYARFSIFTGLYPSYRLEKTLQLGSSYPYQSFFTSLVRDGYDFKVFDPVTTPYAIDDWVVKQMGGAVVGPDDGGGVPEKDARVLGKLIREIKRAAAAKTPFAYAFLPQLTHGPWLAAGATKDALYREGLARLKQLDGSLAAIVAALKEQGVYENTVIVLTADHGLRTKKEAGFLKTTVLNDVSYHVPMIIHDPMLKKAVTIDAITSHLDISPTLHCIYSEKTPDIRTQRKIMTGLVRGPRKLFFGGAWYNGSDGMWDGKDFYSYNRQLDMVWESKRFDFDEARPLPESSLSKSVVALFDYHGSAQEAVLSN